LSESTYTNAYINIFDNGFIYLPTDSIKCPAKFTDSLQRDLLESFTLDFNEFIN
jgi:hypothetical protein